MRMKKRISIVALSVLVVLAGCSTTTPGSQVAADRTPQSPPSMTPLGRSAKVAPCHVETGTGPIAGGLPDLRLNCLGPGPAVNLIGMRGPAVINLWASWCGPCRRETPRLQKASQATKDQTRFVGVDTKDDRASAVTFLQSTGARYEQLADPDGTLLRALTAPGLPVTVAINEEGRVVWRKAGEMSTSDIQAAVKASRSG